MKTAAETINWHTLLWSISSTRTKYQKYNKQIEHPQYYEVRRASVSAQWTILPVHSIDRHIERQAINGLKIPGTKSITLVYVERAVVQGIVLQAFADAKQRVTPNSSVHLTTTWQSAVQTIPQRYVLDRAGCSVHSKCKNAQCERSTRLPRSGLCSTLNNAVLISIKRP